MHFLPVSPLWLFPAWHPRIQPLWENSPEAWGVSSPRGLCYRTLAAKCRGCMEQSRTLGLFQKLSSRGVSHIFFRPLHLQDTQGVGAPRPPGHVSALINPPHYGSNMPWPPGQVTPPPPTPRTHCQQNTLPSQDKKVFAAHPPEDNFWNSP